MVYLVINWLQFLWYKLVFLVRKITEVDKVFVENRKFWQPNKACTLPLEQFEFSNSVKQFW